MKGISYHHYHSLKEPKKKSCNIERKKLKKCCLCIKVKRDETEKKENLIIVAKEKVGLWIKP